MKLEYTLISTYHIARADFFQRIRSYNFLIALGACVFLIYSFVPDLDAGYVMVSLGNYRGSYNSAWIGGMVANCVPFFVLIGFYVVNYAVKRDVDTGVGQIIATTRLTKVQYLTGKLFSNFAVLIVLLIVIAAMTVVMFLVRGESSSVEFGKLLLPLLLLTVPATFTVASIALFFDSLTRLSRGVINIIYFFIWTFLIGSSLISPLADVFGMNIFLTEVKNTLSAVHHDWNGDFGTGILLRDSPIDSKVFTWEGMTWTKTTLFPRIFWMIISFGLVLLASIGFNRFDSSKTTIRQSGNLLSRKKKSIWIRDNNLHTKIKLGDAPLPETRFRFFSILLVNMRMMLKGNFTLWLIITALLLIISLFSPIDFAYRVALPLLWFFQTLILSRIGSREVTNRCSGYIFSAPFPIKRQLPASLFAAVLFMLLLATPVLLRVLLTGNFYGIYAIVTSALFIPTFAITLGMLTGGSKLFEVIFTVIVYGYFNSVPFFDITGAIEKSHEFGMANFLLVITLILVGLSFLLRKRQIVSN